MKTAFHVERDMGGSMASVISHDVVFESPRLTMQRVPLVMKSRRADLTEELS